MHRVHLLGPCRRTMAWLTMGGGLRGSVPPVGLVFFRVSILLGRGGVRIVIVVTAVFGVVSDIEIVVVIEEESRAMSGRRSDVGLEWGRAFRGTLMERYNPVGPRTIKVGVRKPHTSGTTVHDIGGPVPAPQLDAKSMIRESKVGF
jgi:hypothetical protein